MHECMLIFMLCRCNLYLILNFRVKVDLKSGS
uniref:Uncharacterized protein n=1 Tax=Anguilla anguilla TaxID=7936 RepID=A0A0E9UAN9_ANGAN